MHTKKHLIVEYAVDVLNSTLQKTIVSINSTMKNQLYLVCILSSLSIFHFVTIPLHTTYNSCLELVCIMNVGQADTVMAYLDT